MTTSTIDTAAPAAEAAGAPDSGGPDRTSPRALVQLARFEARRLARHPATVLGLVLASLLHAASTAQFRLPFTHGVDDRYLILGNALAQLALHAAPLLVGLLVATYLTVSRSRRHGTEELLEPLALRPGGRTAAHLLTGLVTVAIVTAWTVLATAYILSLRTIGPFSVADALQPVALSVAVAGLGVAAGTWVRSVALFVLGLVGVLFLQLFLNAGQGGPDHTLAPILAAPAFHLPEYVVRPVSWHLVYVVGVGAVVGTIALLRHGPTLRRAVAGALGLAVLATGTATQYAAEPTLAELEAIAATAIDPPVVCEGDDAVEVCTMPAYTEIADAVRHPVATALASLPADLRPDTPLRVEQSADRWDARFPVETWFGWTEQQDLMRHLRLDWHDDVPWGGGVVYEPTDTVTANIDQWSDAQALALAVEVTRRAVGIPAVDRTVYTWTDQDIDWFTEQGWDDVPTAGDTVTLYAQCWLAGQAREAVAVLLAATADPAFEERLRWMVADKPYFKYEAEDGRIVGWYGASMWNLHGGGSAIDWSNAGAHVAAALLDVPGARDTVLSEWDRWTASDAAVNDLLDRFGLDPLPTWAEHAAAHGMSAEPGTDIDPLQYGRDLSMFGDQDAPLPVRGYWLSPCGGPPLGSFAT